MSTPPRVSYGQTLVITMSNIEDFSEGEHEHIRRELRNYAKTYDLGMPALAKRISAATPNNPKISHRTLARFIGDVHTTNSLLVKWCRDFLKNAAPDPLKEMAEGLIRFYGANHSDLEPGAYAMGLIAEEEQAQVPFSEYIPPAIVEIGEGDGFFRIRLERTRDGMIFDGVLVFAEFDARTAVSQGHMFLRNRRTGLPCICACMLSDDTPLRGTMIEDTPEGERKVYDVCFRMIPNVDTSSPTLGSWVILEEELFGSVRNDQMQEVYRLLSECGFSNIDAIERQTGLTLFHSAIGRNNIELVRFLLARGVRIAPDRRGRWPTLMAAECEVSDELYDLVADAEIATEGKDGESV